MAVYYSKIWILQFGAQLVLLIRYLNFSGRRYRHRDNTAENSAKR